MAQAGTATMNMNRRQMILGTLAAAASATAAAQSGNAAPKEVRIAMNSTGTRPRPGITSATHPTARVIEEGWLEARLKERGIALRWLPITGELGPITNEAFAARRIDFANIGDLPSIILNARGTRTQLIVPNGKGADLFLVVPPDSPAKSIRDLKGKRVSVQLSRPWELGFRLLAQENGLAFEDFQNFNLTPQVSTNALALGNIDAVFGTNGYLLEEKGVGRIIWSSRGSLRYKIRSSELWGARDFIDRYPEITQLVATAYVRAQHWASLEESRDAAIRQATVNGTPLSVAKRTYDDPAVAWKDHWSPLFDDLVTHHYRQAVDFAVSTKLVARPIRVEELLQPKFVKPALQTLRLEGYWTPVPSPLSPVTHQAHLG
jgi:sulfonate transport system substrate-binding protein